MVLVKEGAVGESRGVVKRDWWMPTRAKGRMVVSRSG